MHLPIGIGSAEYQWLQQDLAANTSPCTLVFAHHPRYNIGPEGDTIALSDIWALMARYGVDLYLAGHDHDYQRWERLNSAGNPDPNGIIQLVVGTGGHGVQQFVRSDSRVAFAFDSVQTAYGALRLELNPKGAGFGYLNTQGIAVDGGAIACSGAPADTAAPTRPSNLAATTGAASPQVDRSWYQSTDDTGVAGYTIYRNGMTLATVNGAALRYSDTSVTIATPYTYTVDAFDASGKHSSQSTSAAVTTSGSFALTAVADAYVDQSSPTMNYGLGDALRLDASPTRNAYLRFNVQGWVPGGRVTLRLLSRTSSSVGAVADNTWSEQTINFSNAPAISSPVQSSGPITAGAWTSIDVSTLVTGNGLHSFGLTTTSSVALTLSSRQALTNAPERSVQLPTPPSLIFIPFVKK